MRPPESNVHSLNFSTIPQPMQEKSCQSSGNLEALQISFSFAHCPTVDQKTQESSACESLPRRRHSHHRLRDLSQRRPVLTRGHNFFECNSDFCKSQAPGASGLQKCDVRHFVQNAEQSSTDLKFHRDHVHTNRTNMNSFFVSIFKRFVSLFATLRRSPRNWWLWVSVRTALFDCKAFCH